MNRFAAVLLSGLLCHGGVPSAAAAAASVLTPTGAEQAGNEDGSIPPWQGGGMVAGLDQEAPILVITAGNFRTYQAKLTDGQQAMFARFPDYRMLIYPSHRSAALPQTVYDAIAANRGRAHEGPGGIARGVAGAAGGIPFPVPQNGWQAVWNHLLGYWGVAREDRIHNYFVAADGTLTLTNDYREIVDFPYYAPGVTPESVGDYIYKRREVSDGPANLAGRGYLSWQPLDVSRTPVQAWQYLPREQKVRKSPLLSHDTPTPDGAGLQSFDDYYIFSGPPDRYDFTLVGKAELFIPYNNQRFYRQSIESLAGRHFLDPGALRYELHRVWVVDGVLAKGSHHLVPHRRLYLDEDSWFAVYGEGWDAEGRLWKFSHAIMTLLPQLPAMVPGSQVTYDLQSGGYFLGFTFNHQAEGLRPTALHDPALFSPESLTIRD